ncbi:uncharacterized protein [Gossypium hirsutum]|uniref:G-patch domain-containing protein n=1 Tax=Gossypium hirsutum TaxID=3635 RepID=A0ABM3BA13_GOSHI|nr:uncharacterized protein LOC121224510 [Gossypium hirsutum]
MIENAIRSGKIDAGESNRRSASKRKDNEVNNASMYNKGYSKSVTVSQPGKVATNQQSSSRQEAGTRRNTERPQFTPIPMSYRELYRNLFDAHVVFSFYLKPLQPPYPKWYDANAQCYYHAGITGHFIENCTTFKKLVERLIGMGVVKFDEATKVENPLPNHTDSGINMMGEDRKIKADIADVKTPLRWVWKDMVKRGLIASEESCENRRNYCEFHCEMGHEIQECTEFRAVVQGMMDNKEMEFCEGVQKENHVCTSELALGVPKANHPVVIISRPKNSEAGARVAPKVIIQKPIVFTYKDNMRVPWNYNCNVTIPGKEDAINKEDHDEEGHDEQVKARVEPIKKETSDGKKKKTVELELLVNEPIKEEEAREFLKFIKHSEYNIVEQLHKQPTRISVLNETYVADDISVNKLDRLVGNISADNFISLSDDEIPPGGMGSTRALHITARCKGCILPGVLVDNGSALNVLPLSTLNRLPVDSSHMKSCQNVVRAFDGTERRVMGRIDIPLLIGLTIYEVDFLVMDIKPSYSCLLGRPWIHSAGTVPSSLHQKLKLVSEGRVVTIDAEEDIIASVTNDVPYLETSDDAIECSFRSLEFVNATFIHEGNKIPMPRISRTTEMGLQLTVGKGALPRRGLGRYLQGRVEAPVLKDKQDRFGLGYKPDARQKRIEPEKKRVRRRARLTGDEVKWEPMIFPHLSKTFVSGGFVYQGMLGVRSINTELGSIHAVYEEATRGRTLPDIRPYESERELNNWTAEEIPVVFRISSESYDINDANVTLTNLESPFERSMCLEGSHDFEDNEDCGLSPDLLKMVEKAEKQILPHRESIEIVSLEEGKEDMPGLSTDIVVHRLPIREYCKPVQQKLRRMRPDIVLKIKEEIKMHPEDMRKTTFITLWGTFCYKVMSFRLKNAGATYQRAMKHNPGTWDEECEEAFNKVKQYLSNTPVLSPPSPDRPLILYLTKAVKGSAIADFLASRALEDYEPLSFDFPNEDLMCIAATEENPQKGHGWRLNFDGASNAATENEKRTLRRLAIDYVLDGEILYKRGKDQVLLRCVDVVEAKKILEEVHEGICGTHASEAASYANVTKSSVSKFLKREIICRYGMPERIISDNALNLNNSSIAEAAVNSRSDITIRCRIARK